MKRICTFILLLLSVLMSHAQTQQGYAKTLGRPNKKGKPLSGVSVRASGGHNSVLSNTNGTFSLMMPGKRNGDAYKLQQVRKAGYELNETGIIGRTLAFSDKVPLTIVMVSSEQLQADKLRIENRAYKVAENNYKSRLATLEKKREEKHITAEQYRKELQSLQDRFEKYQALIGSLAEHYAHTDYDSLGEKEREINICIEEGRLEKADSLIHTLFDPLDVLRRNKELLEGIDKNIIQAKDIIRQADEDMKAVLKQQAKDAEYLFQLYTISLARFDNIKAAQYIETRALLDTTNVKWQLEAGVFFFEYLADYSKAMALFNNALHNAVRQSGEQNPDVAISYNNIGSVYDSQGEYNKAMEYYQKALQIQQTIFGEQHPKVATSYNNIGLVYYSQGNYNKAMEYYQKAIGIWKIIFGEQHPDVATSYNNIGNVYFLQGEYNKALEYHLKALHIKQNIFGEQHPDVATSYNNIGYIYQSQKDYDKALEYYPKALQIQQAIFGEQNPNVATSYISIGNVFINQGNIAKALVYYKKSLSIYMSLYGNNDENVKAICNLIYMSYCLSLKQSTDLKQDFYDFISEYAYTITVTNKENTYKDEFYLLECNDWYMDSMGGVLYEFERSDKPKDIAVMKDGNIRKYHLNSTVGCKVGLKYVGKDEKIRIVSEYYRWKKNK